ncbi:MAG: molybdopterin-dependent oxidoreductase, partial [Thermodesulfobacteriota bacterium]
VAPENTLLDRVSPDAAMKKLGYGESIPLNPGVRHPVFWDAVLEQEPYPVKALLIMGTNPLLTSSDPLKGEEALKALDFSVAIDLFMNPTAQLADIVLPAASWLEQDDVADLHFIWCVAARQKVAEIGECWDDKKILIELAKRLGLEEFFPWKDVREWCDYVLEDSGLDFEAFKEVGLIQGKMRYRK